jgi:hypothetical protein
MPWTLTVVAAQSGHAVDTPPSVTARPVPRFGVESDDEPDAALSGTTG